jgi:DNA helicase II / ATP-dependent DNA helicase PcrA
MKSIIKDDLKLDEKKYPPRSIGSFISNAKNALITASKYEKYVDSHIKEIVNSAYKIYEKRLDENNALDFDDILLKTLEILQIPENLEYYQERYKYIMVDEYQDTNAPQYEIVKLLASRYRNLAVV